MSDSPGSENPRAPEEVVHSAEETADFNRRAEIIGDYAQLVSAQIEGEQDALDTESKVTVMANEDRAAREEIEARHYTRIRWLTQLLITVMVVLVLAVWLYTARGTDVTEDLAGSEAPVSAADSGGEQAAANTPAALETAEGALSGTWRVYHDSAQAVPFLDLTFQPNGAADLLMPYEGGGDMSVESWTYAEDGDSVEIELIWRVTDDSPAVDYTQMGWLHLTRNGQEMTGSYEQQVTGYSPDGTMYDHGVQQGSTDILSVPTPTP